MESFNKNLQYYKFCLYGFFKNQRFFDPFLVVYFLDEGLSFIQIGTLYALREILINLVEIPSGVIADALGRRWTLMISFVFYMIAFLVLGLGNNFAWFLVGMVWYSLGDGFRTGTHKAMIYDYLLLNNWSQHKVDYYGHTRSWSQMGSALSALVGGVIVVLSSNYRLVLFAAIVPYIINFFLVYSYPKVLDGELKRLNGSRFRQGFIDVYHAFKGHFKQRDLWQAMGNVSLYQGVFKAAKDYLQPIIMSVAVLYPIIAIGNKEQNIAAWIALIYFILFLVGAWSARNSKAVLARFSSSAQFLNASLIAGILVLLVSGFMHSRLYSIPAIFIFMLLFAIQNLRKSIGTAFVADKLKQSVLATGLSIQSQVDSLMGAFFAFLLGFLAEYFGVGLAMVSLALILLLFSLFFRLKD